MTVQELNKKEQLRKDHICTGFSVILTHSQALFRWEIEEYRGFLVAHILTSFPFSGPVRCKSTRASWGTNSRGFLSLKSVSAQHVHNHHVTMFPPSGVALLTHECAKSVCSFCDHTFPLSLPSTESKERSRLWQHCVVYVIPPAASGSRVSRSCCASADAVTHGSWGGGVIHTWKCTVR